MNIKITLAKDAVLPACAHESDTGYDVVAASEPKIVGKEFGGGYWASIDYIEYDTGISVEPELDNGTQIRENVWVGPIKYGFLDVRPRSSISKYNLVLANPPATIDHAYRGTIKLRFKYMWQPKDMIFDTHGGTAICYGAIDTDKIYKKGDKIGQLVAAWKQSIKWDVVESLSETQRGAGGFGSSGK